MSQVIATTTTPPVKVVCSKESPITMIVIMAATSVGLAASVVLPPQVIPRVTVRGSFGLITLPQWQQPQSQKPSQAYASCVLGPLEISFLFQSWASHWFINLYVGGWYGVCFLLSGSHVTAILTNEGTTIGVYNAKTLRSISLPDICASWWWSVAHARSALSGCSFHCFG